MTEERTPIPRSEEEMAANAAKLKAEAAKAEAETRNAQLEAETSQIRQKMDEMLLEQKRLDHERKVRSEQERLASDSEHRVYRFIGAVDKTSTGNAIEKLVQWHRLDPECDITIIFHSPGGGIIEGFALFDTILYLRDQGHHVTTVAEGMAASMAGILLQAGDVRVMTPQSALLIHEASFGAMGSFGKVEDQVKFVEKLQGRILDIFAERSEMSREDIEAGWHRKDWWMLADEALEAGFVDEIR